MKFKNLILFTLLVFLSFAGFSQALRTIKTDHIETNAPGGTVDVIGDFSLNSSSATLDTVLDEDDLATNSDTAIPTQQSVKAYVDAQTVNELNDLDDVSLSATSTDQVLTFDGTNWVNATSTIQSIDRAGDVTITSATTGEILSYDGTDWVNGTLTISSLDDIGDVSLTSATTGQVLTFDGVNWINSVGSGGGISPWTTSTPYLIGNIVHEDNHIYKALTDHTSTVFATDLANGDWIEQTDASIGGIGDVTVTSATSNDVLSYNGTNWINQDNLELDNILINGTSTFTGISTIADGSVLATSAAPTSDAMISNKKYVDDLIAAITDADVAMSTIPISTYDNVEDWNTLTQSAGVTSGGDISDGGSGTINIAALTGLIKSTNSEIGVNMFFDLGASTGLALTDESINYVSVDYNAGVPQIIIGTTNTANGHTIFNLGKVFREGTILDILDSGLRVYDLSKRVQQHHVEESGLHFVSGALVAETGTRNISITAGIMYAGLNRIVTPGIDTSVADTFEYYYYDGAAWQETDETQIDNLQYNDIATGLATLSNNRYGVHWVYKGTNGNSYVIYGQDSYTLSEAQGVQPPASIPSHVSEMGVIRARILIQKSATVFTEIDNASGEFTGTSPSDHNELTNLQLAASAVTWGHIDDQAQTIVGTKTFSDTLNAANLYLLSGAGLDSVTTYRLKRAGADYLTFNSTDLQVSLPFKAVNGTMARPMYSFTGMLDGGLWRDSANDSLKIGVNGADAIEFDDDYIEFFKPIKDLKIDSAIIPGINSYIKNGTAEIDTTGWACTGNLSIARNTTAPLYGDGDFEITAAATSSDDYCAYDFDLENGDLASMLNFTIASIKDNTNFDTGDASLRLYDLDAAAYVLGELELPASTIGTKANWGFQTAAASTNYELRIVSNVDTTYSFNADNISSNIDKVVYGAPTTDWIEYTPTMQGFGTITNQSSAYRRIGDTIELQISFVVGTPTAVEGQIGLPSGLTAGTLGSGIIHLVGKGTRNNAGASFPRDYTVLSTNGDTFLNYGLVSNTSSVNALTPQNGNQYTASGDAIRMFARLPIQGWSSNVQLSSTTQNREIMFEAYKTGGAQTIPANTSTDILFETTSPNSSASYNSVTGIFTAPEDGSYIFSYKSRMLMGATAASFISTNIDHNGAVRGLDFQNSMVANKEYSQSATEIIEMKKGETVKISTFSSAQSTTAADLYCYFSGAKLNTGSQTIAQDASVYVDGAGNAGTVVTANVTNIDFTKTDDSHGAWNGTQFTAPTAGRYSIVGAVHHDNISAAFDSYIDGSVDKRISQIGTYTIHTINGVASLEKGQVLSIRSNTGITLSNTAQHHHISITRMK